MQRPPAWLAGRIGEEIRRGIRLMRKEGELSHLQIGAIRFRLLLGGEWQEIVFDGEGHPLAGVRFQ